MEQPERLLTLTSGEAETAAAVFGRLFPMRPDEPSIEEIGVVAYLDRTLAGHDADRREQYRRGLAALERAARAAHDRPFAGCASAEQDALLSRLERGTLPDLPDAADFFATLRAHLQEGLFADPYYGGNREKRGWRLLGHTGYWAHNSAKENLAKTPVTKRGKIFSMADHGYVPGLAPPLPPIPGYDPDAGARRPTRAADVVIVGCGGMGALAAGMLADAGLRVVALEAGPWRRYVDFLPDELGHAYYCRAGMGERFLAAAPRWRRDEQEQSRPATYSLGRMMNGVGGSIVHYGAWLRRYHPHHFAPLATLREQGALHLLPDGCTLADWPVTYNELEPYYTLIEHIVGVSGNDENPFTPRSLPLPMPPLRPFRLGECFRVATRAMGLHPYPVPVGVNSIHYAGRPATIYSAWSNGFGSFDGDKWHPALDMVPRALATGNLDLRTHCTAIRVITGGDGRVNGVEYLSPHGERMTQEAPTVILCGHTFENVRLLFLSGDGRRPHGLGNNAGQLGKHFMTKMFAHVDGFFPDTIFNRHTGPAAQGVVLDDYLARDFEGFRNGFLGGGTLGAENQFLPIQISRESLPPDVPTWGTAYRAHIAQWQHLGVVRIQPDALPYQENYLDLDPDHREVATGLPVIRATYDLQPDEHRRSDWLERRAEEILVAMGAAKTWRGPRFTGVGSSHEMGGCRMGVDPAASVLDPELRVHDTPGLYVFGGAACPSCPGINPTLTLWALCARATERLITRLTTGERSHDERRSHRAALN